MERLCSLNLDGPRELHNLGALARLRVVRKCFPPKATASVRGFHNWVDLLVAFTIFEVVDLNSYVIAQHIVPDKLNNRLQGFLQMLRLLCAQMPDVAPVAAQVCGVIVKTSEAVHFAQVTDAQIVAVIAIFCQGMNFGRFVVRLSDRMVYLLVEVFDVLLNLAERMFQRCKHEIVYIFVVWQFYHFGLRNRRLSLRLDYWWLHFC